MKIDKYVAVEVKAFGQGMQKMFEGMAEVFGSIGADEPDRLILEKAKWKHEGNAAGVSVAEDDTAEVDTEKTDTDSAVPDAGKVEEPKAEEALVEEVSADEDASSDEETVDTPAEEAPVETKAPLKKKETSITKEDIQKIIVQKIKKDRSNSGKIGELLKTYGASTVSDLPESKYEDFLTEIAAL